MVAQEELANEVAEFRKTFISEISGVLENVEECLLSLMENTKQGDQIDAIFRYFHTIKGSGASVGLTDISRFVHKAEDCLQIFRSKPELLTLDHISLLFLILDSLKERLHTALSHDEDPNWNTLSIRNQLDLIGQLAAKPKIESSKISGFGIFDEDDQTVEKGSEGLENIENEPFEGQAVQKSEASSHVSSQKSGPISVFKVSSEKIDHVLESLGELVVIKNQLLQSIEDLPSMNDRIGFLVGQLDKGVREIHEKTLSMRLVPLTQTFRKLQRSILETARALGKEVEIEVEGNDTEIDRIVAEEIADPLMHICRNSVDHGIETMEERKNLGKPGKGLISFHACQDGNYIVIEVSDNGAGIDQQLVLDSALSKGLITEKQARTFRTEQVYDLLLAPGFSTKKVITDVSGRGVGMDVVKSNIQKLNGTITISSELGKGTSVILKLPLSTSITEGIHVEISRQQYIIPIHNIQSFGEFNESDLIVDGSTEFAHFQNHHHQLIRLAPLLGHTHPSTGRILILAEARNRRFLINVDRVIGKIQVVLKPVDSKVENQELYHGAAVMGDGRVAIVLDLGSIQDNVNAREYAA